MRGLASTIVWSMMAAGIGIGLFFIKHEVKEQEARLAELNNEIERNQEATHVLRAEWSFLNDPARLRTLSERHLGMKPMAPAQIATLDSLPHEIDTAPVYAAAPAAEPISEQPKAVAAVKAPAAPPERISPPKVAAPPTPPVRAAPPAALVQAAPPTALVRAAPPTTLVRAAPPTALVRAAPPTTLVRAAPPTTLVRAAPPTTLVRAAPPPLAALPAPAGKPASGRVIVIKSPALATTDTMADGGAR